MSKNVLNGFLPIMSADGDLYNSKDVEVILQSVWIILTTPLGSRVWQPEFGCRLLEYIFDLYDSTTLKKMEDAVTNSLERWEPRIKLNKVEVTSKKAGHVDVLIDFTFDRRDYTHKFYINDNLDALDLTIYDLKINK